MVVVELVTAAVVVEEELEATERKRVEVCSCFLASDTLVYTGMLLVHK